MKTQVLTGAEFLALCASLKRQGKRVACVDVVFPSGYIVRGITSTPNQFEFELSDPRRPSPFPERASDHKAHAWFQRWQRLREG